MDRFVDLSVTVDSSTMSPPSTNMRFDATPHNRGPSSWQVSIVHQSLHTGAHIDSPLHVFKNGITTAEISLDQVMGEALDVDLSGVGANHAITIDDLKKAGAGDVKRGDTVLLRADWTDKRYGTWPDYFTQSPCFSPELAQWLVDRGPKNIGFDFFGEYCARLADFTSEDFAMHRVILGAGVVIMEGLTNLGALPRRRVDLAAPFYKFEYFSGIPEVGIVPRAPHAGPLMRHVYEQEHGRAGFAGKVSHTYHLYPPTNWLPEESRLLDGAGFAPHRESPLHPVGGVHHALGVLEPEAPRDVYRGMGRLIANATAAMNVTAPAAPMDYVFEHHSATLVSFVHEGSGTLETTFGPIACRKGDFLIIPKGITRRFECDPGPQYYWVCESFAGDPEKAEAATTGQFLTHSRSDYKFPRSLDTRNEAGRFEIVSKTDGTYARRVHPTHPFDAVGWRSPLVIGHSLGGYVGAYLAARHPDRVGALVITDTMTQWSEEETAWALKQVERPGPEFAHPSEADSRYRLSPPETKAPADWIRHLGEAAVVERKPGVWHYAVDRRVFAQARPDAWPLLPGIACPTLVVRGEGSRIMDRDAWLRVATAVQRGQFAEVKDDWHHLILDDPAGFCSIVTTWLHRLVTPTQADSR